MKVLFISPLDPVSPGNYKYLVGGESTYSKTLLQNPPPGISYDHYEQALEKKRISFTLWQLVLKWLMKLRILPIGVGAICVKLNYQYDLIHCHAYGLKLSGDIRPPVILGDSSSNLVFLRDYLLWPEWRVRLQIGFKKKLYHWLNIYDQDVNIADAKYLLTFSHWAKGLHNNCGIRNERIKVIPPGLPKQKRFTTCLRKQRSFADVQDDQKVTILFAGVWFERKGGLILLKAYRKLKEKFGSKIKLIILGPIPKGVKLDKEIYQQDYVSYYRLITEFYPRTDILVLVPPQVEGYGLVVNEAASFGIVRVVSDIGALPELVIDNKTGLVVKPGSVVSLVVALEKVITNKKLRVQLGQQAKKDFARRYSIAVVNHQLNQVYLAATKE